MTLQTYEKKRKYEKYSKVTSIITAVFILAIAAGIGLACYYWIWLKTTMQTFWKGCIFAAFGLYGLCELLIGIVMVLYTWDFFGMNDKDETKIGIAGIILCGVIPGIMYLVDLHLYRSWNSQARYEDQTGSTTRTSSTGTTPKRRTPNYDIRKDPSIIVKRQSGGSSSTPTGKKKKLVYEGSGSTGTTSGKKKLVYDRGGSSTQTTTSGKKKLVYKGGSSTSTSSGKKKLVYKK